MATVGQAFLCNIKTKAHPHVGEECVVKLLRPNVDTAIQREMAFKRTSLLAKAAYLNDRRSRTGLSATCSSRTCGQVRAWR